MELSVFDSISSARIYIWSVIRVPSDYQSDQCTIQESIGQAVVRILNADGSTITSSEKATRILTPIMFKLL